MLKMSEMLFSFSLNVMLSMSKIDQIDLRAVMLCMSEMSMMGKEHTHTFLDGLSLHLNHLIASHMANYNWPFGTLSFGLFGSNLDTRDLETYPRSYSGHF